jgi:hypothetical protein
MGPLATVLSSTALVRMGLFRENPAARKPDRRRRKSRPETLRQQQRQTLTRLWAAQRRALESDGLYEVPSTEGVRRTGA